MRLFRFIGIFYVVTFASLVPAQTKMSEEFSSPLFFCGEVVWEKSVKYYNASDNHNHIYFSYSENKNQIINFSLKDRNILWKTEVEGEIISVFDSSKKNEVQVLSSNKLSFFLTNLNVESGINLSQTAYSIINYNILSSIDKKEFILFNKLTLQSIYFGYIGQTFVNSGFDLTEKKLNETVFQIFGNRIYFIETNQLTAFNLPGIESRSIFSPTNKSGITEVNLSLDTLSVGFNNGEVSALGSDFRKIWKIKTGGKIRFIKNLDDSILVISDDNFIYLFAKKNGNLIWKFKNQNRLINAPVVIDGVVFVFDILENNLKILSLDKGILINQLLLGEKKVSEGEIIYKDKKLYLILSDRILFYSITSKC